MPTNTSKFNLVKPLKSEKYNVDVFNGNADIIDSQIYSKTEVDTALNGKANSVHTHVKADINDFAHTHPISEVTNLQTSLNGKANTTTTVNNKALSSNITINASDVPNTPAGNISATNVQNAINELDTEKVDKLMATNLITNGDFSNGTTGWSAFNGVQTASNGIYTNTGNGTNRFVFTDQNLPILNARYYVKIKFRVTNSSASSIFVNMLGNTSGGNFNVVNIPTPVANQWYDVSTITNISNAVGTHIIFRFSADYLNPTNANGMVIECDNALVINLTATFGAGNEPTRDQMDKLLSVYPDSWFNGTSEVGSIGALMRATLGVKLVTPTLLNSRTGTAQYVVSNDGLVIFRGTASGGSLNTNIFVLPENIRPVATRVFPISANSAFGVVTVATNGEVRQTVGALTNVFLDGIVFKVGV